MTFVPGWSFSSYLASSHFPPLLSHRSHLTFLTLHHSHQIFTNGPFQHCGYRVKIFRTVNFRPEVLTLSASLGRRPGCSGIVHEFGSAPPGGQAGPATLPEAPWLQDSSAGFRLLLGNPRRGCGVSCFSRQSVPGFYRPHRLRHRR